MTLFKNEACFYFFVGKTRRSDALIAFVKSHLTFEYKGTLNIQQVHYNERKPEIQRNEEK